MPVNHLRTDHPPDFKLHTHTPSLPLTPSNLMFLPSRNESTFTAMWMYLSAVMNVHDREVPHVMHLCVHNPLYIQYCSHVCVFTAQKTNSKAQTK